MNREQRRAAMNRKLNPTAQMPQEKPVQVRYGHNSVDRVVMEFSAPVRTMAMTVEQANATIANLAGASDALLAAREQAKGDA